MDIWTRIETQIDCIYDPRDKARMTATIVTWRLYDLVSFGAHLCLLLALFRHWNEPMIAIVLAIAYFIARGTIRPLAWFVLPNRPRYG